MVLSPSPAPAPVPDPRIARTTALALSAFARDSAIDSAVYDLQAYDPGVPATSRYVAISRDGIYGWFRDSDAAALEAPKAR